MSNILVSIIIPAYKDWARLALCIEALTKQTFAKEKFEIIIVNNSPEDLPPVNFSLPANGKIIVEERPGSYAARNAAIQIAQGSIMGFTDSDCIPDKYWIECAVDYFDKNPSCSRIAGKVAIFCSSPGSRIELYDKLYAFNQKNYVERSGTSVTANLFTYKDVFDKIGYFDASLMSGGDFLWGTIAAKNNYKVDYVETVIVNHPARDSLKELIKKERRVGSSQADFLKKNNYLGNLVKFLKELRPRLSDIRFINSKKHKLTTGNKIYIIMLRHYLLGVRAYAKLKMQIRKGNSA